MSEAVMHTGDYWCNPNNFAPNPREEMGAESVLDPAAEHTFTERMAVWAKKIRRIDDFLADELNLHVHIDEVAVIFRDHDQRHHAIDGWVTEQGVEHFNAAVDRVVTQPIQSRYTVRYDFLRHMDYDFRVEAMTLTSGVSPLHEAHLHGIVPPVVVHFSFKCSTPFNYEGALNRMIDSGKFIMAQTCESDYGRFSYWNTEEDKFGQVYIKPRVNLRDRAEGGNR